MSLAKKPDRGFHIGSLLREGSGAARTLHRRSVVSKRAGLGDPGSRHHIGSSTVSITWMTPFDCSTSAIVTVATLPLASVTESLPGPACLIQMSPPAAVLSLAVPSPSLIAFINEAAVMRPGTT